MIPSEVRFVALGGWAMQSATLLGADQEVGPRARAARWAALLEEAREVQRRIDRLHERLAAHPDPEGPGELELAERLGERRRLWQEVGRALVEASAAGAQLHLAWPGAPEKDPSPTLDLAPAAVPEAPQVVAAPPRPAADATLLQLAQRGLAPRWVVADARASEDRSSELGAVMDAVGPPLVVDDDETLDAEARRIAQEAERIDRWRILDRAAQQAMLSYAAAKARYLQERARDGSAASAITDGLDPAFRVMNKYSKDHRPGFVWGLSRSHVPKRGTWLQDAEQLWQELLEIAGRSPRVDTNPERALARLERRLETEPEEEAVREAALDVLASGVSASDPRLQKLLEPYVDALTGRPLRALRRAIRAPGDDVADEEGALVPADWPWFGWTEGKLAVVVGGDRRAEAASRLESAFRFSEVSWDSDVQGTRLVAIAERVHRRTIGMVVFLARLSGHGAQAVLLESCKQAGVPFVRIERGYGVTAVRRAIEQLLAPATLSPSR